MSKMRGVMQVSQGMHELNKTECAKIRGLLENGLGGGRIFR